MTKGRKVLIAGITVMLVFVIFTILVVCYDVREIGLNGTDVGFAGLNNAFCMSFGTNSVLYAISTVTGYLAFLIVAFFAGLGVLELIQRKSLIKVDYSILTMGILYFVTAVLYVAFDKIVINYRPVYEDGLMESSYPSSHVLLSICIYVSAIYAFGRFDFSDKIKSIIAGVCAGLAVITCICRLFSGVHWLTDIIGGVLLGAALVLTYVGVNLIYQEDRDNGRG